VGMYVADEVKTTILHKKNIDQWDYQLLLDQHKD